MKLETSNLIQEYRKVKRALASYFGQSGLIFDVEDSTDVKWTFSNRSLYWSEKFDPSEDEEHEFSEEAVLVASTEELSLYLIYSCTGDKYYMILDNSKEIKNV